LKQITEILESDKRPHIKRVAFDNGAILLHQQAPGMSGAYATISFLAGSRFEKTEQQGIAHFLEHMIFKGGKLYKSGELTKIIENEGGDINAFTTKETLSFEVASISYKMDKIFSYLLDLVFGANFPDNEILKEKEVVIQEMNDELDDFELQAEEKLYQKMFKFPIGHPIGGTEKFIRSFTKEDLTRFYKKYIKPNRMVVSIISNDNYRTYVGLLEKSFIRYKFLKEATPFRLKLRKKSYKIPSFNILLKRDTENGTLFLATTAHTIQGEERAEYNLINLYLSAGMSSKLFTILREEEGLVYSVESELSSFSDCGCLLIFLTCLPKNLRHIKQKISTVFKDLAKNGFIENELAYLKQMAIDSFDLGLDSIEERCLHMARGELLATKILNKNDLKNIFNHITNEDIKKVANKIYSSKFSSIKIIPQKT
jgi:predicted Zn-dependent peptidase